MFGNWAISLPSIPVPPRAVKTEASSEPRDTIDITFPRLDIASPHDPTFCSDHKKLGLCTLFKNLRKLPDITPEHLRSLNLSLTYDVPITEFIPPPREEDKAKNPRDTWFPVDDGPNPIDDTFKDRRRELMVKNEDAFETLARLRRDIKIGHFYKFYQSLEMVNTYYSPPEGPIAGMPEKFREDMVRNFVEPMCWAFNARLAPPRGPPRVQLQNSRFLTRIDFFIYLTPTLAAERKQGLMEGPLFGIQCRNEEFFIQPKGDGDSTSKPPSPAKTKAEKVIMSEEKDTDGDIAMKETVASPSPKPEEPAAETNTDISTVAKIGDKEQGPGAAVSSAANNLWKPAELTEEEKRRAQRRKEEKEIRIKKGSWSDGDVWDVLKEVGALLCIAQDRRKGGKGEGGIGKGKVEKKIRYRAIGRDNPHWDDVFLVSSIHHHISFSHLRVSSAYLRFLETGVLPNPEHELIKDKTSDWHELKVRKTKWFDLFKGDDRVEAARLVAGILRFLSRKEGF